MRWISSTCFEILSENNAYIYFYTDDWEYVLVCSRYVSHSVTFVNWPLANKSGFHYRSCDKKNIQINKQKQLFFFCFSDHFFWQNLISLLIFINWSLLIWFILKCIETKMEQLYCKLISKPWLLDLSQYKRLDSCHNLSNIWFYCPGCHGCQDAECFSDIMFIKFCFVIAIPVTI